jgi:hypothetical protein
MKAAGIPLYFAVADSYWAPSAPMRTVAAESAATRPHESFPILPELIRRGAIRGADVDVQPAAPETVGEKD